MSIPFTKIKNKLGLDDILPTGRHMGYTVLEVIKDRPYYISWLIQNTSWQFHTSVHDELARHITKHVPRGAGVRNNYYGTRMSDYDYDTLVDFCDPCDQPF